MKTKTTVLVATMFVVATLIPFRARGDEPKIVALANVLCSPDQEFLKPGAQIPIGLVLLNRTESIYQVVAWKPLGKEVLRTPTKLSSHADVYQCEFNSLEIEFFNAANQRISSETLPFPLSGYLTPRNGFLEGIVLVRFPEKPGDYSLKIKFNPTEYKPVRNTVGPDDVIQLDLKTLAPIEIKDLHVGRSDEQAHETPQR